MTADESRERLRLHIVTKHRTQTAAAKEWGVSVAHLSAVLRGKKRLTAALLDEIGLVRAVSVEYVEQGATGAVDAGATTV